MTDAEAVLALYCILWTIAGHWYALRRWEARRKHRRRSKAAQKAADTRKRNNPASAANRTAGKSAPKPRAKKQKTLDDRVVQAESAWFSLINDEDESPDYNEVDMTKWQPQVRRFDGTAKDYAARDREDGSV